MNNCYQHTIKFPVHLSDIGIHTGKIVNIRILPAEADQGIRFKRVDLQENNIICATYDNVIDTNLCTVISNAHGASVSTVEHIMSALWAAGIDNAIIEIDNEETPIVDGSAMPFMSLLRKAGVKKLPEFRKYIEILKPILFEHQGKSIELLPNNSFEVDFRIDFPNSTIGSQQSVFNENDHVFIEEIAKARTFGFLEDVEKLKSLGLALGASLNNAIALSREGGILNPEGLRYKGEFVKHKILDCIGDLYLAGNRIKGKVIASKAGHLMNNLILRKLFAEPDSYRIVEYADSRQFLKNSAFQISFN